MAPNFWIDAWHRSVADIVTPVVADDVRFPNEAIAVRERGGFLIRLNRTGCSSSAHSSENELDLIRPDFVLDNNDTPEELAAALDEILR